MCCLFAPLPPWPAFLADKKLFAWREEEPSHILSPQLFHRPPRHNDDNSHPFLSLPPSFSICAGVQPFLLLDDTSLFFLLCFCFSHLPLFQLNWCATLTVRKAVDCIEGPKKMKNGRSGFEKINKRVQRKSLRGEWRQAEGGGGFFDKWLFIGSVRHPKQGGEGILWTCRAPAREGGRGDKRCNWVGDPTANLAWQPI